MINVVLMSGSKDGISVIETKEWKKTKNEFNNC